MRKKRVNVVIKRIGVLTSGGDCAGLNCAIRAITHHSIGHYGWEVVGIRKGATGLIHRPFDITPLTIAQCSTALLRTGGTLLGSTNKSTPPFRLDSDTMLFKQGFDSLDLDALVCIGGDGSLVIMGELARRTNIPMIFIPKTIDNDIGCTDLSIGHSTTMEIATEALDRLQSTASSHERVFVLEVMGRDAGHIALASGIAGGADIILIPEIPYTIDGICLKIQSLHDHGQPYAVVVVAESVPTQSGKSITITDYKNRPRYGGIAHYIAQKIEEKLEIDVRSNVLGHAQRGGQPCAQDRLLASAFGVHAVDLLAKGCSGRMVIWSDRQVKDVDVRQVLGVYHRVERTDVLIRTAKSLGIYLGEV